MIFDTKRTLFAMTLLVLAMSSWWLTRTVSTPEKPFDGKTRHDPDYTIQNFNTTVMNELGRRRYVLSGVWLIHYGDDGSSEIRSPYLIQYREGQAAVHTRADNGWMPKDGGEILMNGNVVSARGRDPKGAGGEIRTDSMKILLDK